VWAETLAPPLTLSPPGSQTSEFAVPEPVMSSQPADKRQLIGGDIELAGGASPRLPTGEIVLPAEGRAVLPGRQVAVAPATDR
jgi:hypothetical protein